MPYGGSGASDPALERDAERTAQRVMEGGELGIQRMSNSEIHVQRSTKQTGFGPEGEVGLEHFEEEALQDEFPEIDIDTEEPSMWKTLQNMTADAAKGSFGVLGAMLGAMLGGPVGAGIGPGIATMGQMYVEGTKSELERSQAEGAAVPEDVVEQITQHVMGRIDQQTELDLETGSDNDPFSGNSQS